MLTLASASTAVTTGERSGRTSPPVSSTASAPRLVKLTIWKEMITMEIKCPYCGSEEYEVYDTCGGNGENVQELCACLDCDKQFSVIYVVDCIVKES